MGRPQEIIVYRGQYVCGLFEKQPRMPHILGPFWLQMFSIAAPIKDTNSDVYIEYLELTV